MQEKIDKKKKTLKNLLYTIPIMAASLLPMKEGNAQTIRINAFDRLDAIEQGRIEKPNALYVGVQPIDLGISAGYSRKITHKFGTYLFLSKGKYLPPFNFNTGSSKNSHVGHFKIATGGMIYTRKDFNDSSAFLLFGPSFSFCDKTNYEPGTINEQAFECLSFEGGAGLTLAGKVNVGFLFDPFKGESNVYVGLPFGHH